MNQEQIETLIAQKIARARHSIAQDSLVRHESIWAGVKKRPDNERTALRLAVLEAELDMVRLGAAKTWS